MNELFSYLAHILIAFLFKEMRLDDPLFKDMNALIKSLLRISVNPNS